MSLDSWNYVPIDSTTPDNYGSTDYSEGLGSGDISTSPGNPGVTRIFYVLHSVVPAFLDDLIGYATVTEDGEISRVLPDKHPLYANMYAMEATVAGKGKLGQYSKKFAKYDVAMVTAQYRSPTYPILSDDVIEADGTELDRFVTRQPVTVGGEAMTINSTGMFFCSNVGADNRHLSLNQPPSRPTLSTAFSYVWHWVPNNPDTSAYVMPNFTAVNLCTGKVNSEDFDVNHYNFPPGTVLFLGADPKLMNYRVATGQDRDNIYYEITFNFIYRNNGFIENRPTVSGLLNEYAGHNFIWDQSKQWWDLITTNGNITGGRLMESADLNLLFTIG